MTARELLDEIFRTETVFDQDGTAHNLNSNLDRQEGDFLTKIIRENTPINSIEIGCAYGISSLYICSALEGKNGCFHTIVDPFQSTEWRNIGKLNLERAGINYFEIIEKPSETVLPYLLTSGKKYDFGFIDGFHTFDHTLIDFFYLNRLINVGGIIVIDDVGLPSINKFMRYILNYPAYEVIGHVEKESSANRRAFDLLIRTPFGFLSKVLPSRINYELFASKVMKSDKELKLNSSMIAIKKVKDDYRPWFWYKEF